MSEDKKRTTASDVTSSELLGAVKGFLMDSVARTIRTRSI